ncbi:MAG TPA: toluene-4-monooxygenase system B family protein [Candidatus Binatia bacterium]|nr:toluene-4-monooxygenase system B family protein [Candidatus Binatia bacterium]
MPIPVYGFLQGDTVGLVLVLEEHDTFQTVAQKLQDAGSLRVAPREKVQVIYNAQAMDPSSTVAQAGVQALDRIDVISG